MAQLVVSRMLRLAMLLLLTFCTGGCYTYVHAPGATGRVIDAETRAPIKGACITRPAMWSQRTGRPNGLPSVTIVSDQRGYFELPPSQCTKFAPIIWPNPYSMTASFIVSEEGYATNVLEGVATSRISWRSEFADIALRPL